MRDALATYHQKASRTGCAPTEGNRVAQPSKPTVHRSTPAPPPRLDRIIASIRDPGALERAVFHAAREARDALPASAYRNALTTLADYSVQRTF